MVRAKKGKTPADRLKELFNSPIFRLLQPSLPNLKDKVQLINADLAEPNCGLAPADQELLVRSVLQLQHQTSASEEGGLLQHVRTWHAMHGAVCHQPS